MNMAISGIGAQSTASSAGGGGRTHTIQYGESLSGIASRYGVSVQQLMSANPQIRNPDVIYPGDRLALPGGSGGSGGGARSHTVQSGESLSAIASRYGVSVGQITAANPQVRNPDMIYPGDRLSIPGGSSGGGGGGGSSNSAGGSYTVRAGDVLSSIAARHGVSTQALMAANPQIRNADMIYAGDTLRLPGGGSSGGGGGSAATGGSYTVQPGDALSSIAARHGVSTQALMAANPQIRNADLIFAGDTLRLPGGSGDGGGGGGAAAGGSYTVQSGDTLSAIAARHGVSTQALLAANPQIRNADLIFAGDRIQLPGGAGTGGGTGPVTGPAPSPPPLPGGDAGGISAAQLRQIVPQLSASQAEAVVPHLNYAMAEANINTPQRQAMFIAQLAHESGGFRYLEEIASGAAYEGRADLGNTQPGDGVRYKGRGYIQVTGRHNYTQAGRALGLDLVNNPGLAAQPENAARIAAWYWNSRNINAAADRGDFVQVTRLINGGTNGLADRQNYYARARAALS
ncbi:LysM peptidoglycan-binding domain-containing protein [Luteimonas sp. BDR2-5]|uniref:LysM peptidoglycan-binding domain-containing protein n=1 Tax=Proluteimonas luteida TaxID=2878685 RepID=UPI001E50EAB5|nr:LysM peptidoglycan-binding domain-containing protein [Luteimonas sp. BDR2-5]MCD9028468.1 LysM peptidoglycan-binding domain-containing protein [Luteimonas sp. BDR2-5]